MEFGRRRALVRRRSARTLAAGSDLGRRAGGSTAQAHRRATSNPSVPLYLIMGWAVLFNPGLLLSMPASVVTLLLA
jgi:hypothetical protein